MANFAMVPFGNRVEGNTMSFAGRDYGFQPNASDPLYLHGDGWLSLWQLEDASAEHAQFCFSRSADRVSPYAYLTRQEIRLAGDHEIGRVALGEVERARGPGGAEHGEPVLTQVLLEKLSRTGLVLGEEDGARAHSGRR